MKETSDDYRSLSSIDDRIALIRDNIRQLVEEAAAYSGAQDEARSANRIARQTKDLENLMKSLLRTQK